MESISVEYDNEASDVENKIFLITNLQEWVIRNKISDSAVYELLSILKSESSIELPEDSRTLLQTVRNIEIEDMNGGSFWYNGIKNCLLVLNERLMEPMEIYVNFNIEGLLINKKNKKQFWPILMKINNMQNISPLVVAVYVGEEKPPSPEVFLRKFTNEITDIISNGTELPSGAVITLKINAFICSTSVRAFLKC